MTRIVKEKDWDEKKKKKKGEEGGSEGQYSMWKNVEWN